MQRMQSSLKLTEFRNHSPHTNSTQMAGASTILTLSLTSAANPLELSEHVKHPPASRPQNLLSCLIYNYHLLQISAQM